MQSCRLSATTGDDSEAARDGEATDAPDPAEGEGMAADGGRGEVREFDTERDPCGVAAGGGG